MTKHMVIPDTQVKPGNPLDHLRWAGEYAVEKKPDVIIHIGDHFDMPSLSTYDVGKKSFEGRRYINDINAGIEGMKAFLEPIEKEKMSIVRTLLLREMASSVHTSKQRPHWLHSESL